MFSNFLNNYHKKKQSRNGLKNSHEDCYFGANNLDEKFIKLVRQSKKVKKDTCFIQETDSNFLLYQNQ